MLKKNGAGHDKRYAIDVSKLNKELGWKRSVTFEALLVSDFLIGLSSLSIQKD